MIDGAIRVDFAVLLCEDIALLFSDNRRILIETLNQVKSEKGL